MKYKLIGLIIFWCCLDQSLSLPQVNVKVDAESNSLLVIHSYAPNEWTKSLDKGLNEGLTGSQISTVKSYHYHYQYWETQSETDRKKEHQKIISLATSDKSTPVLLCDDEATDFLIQALVKQGVRVFFYWSQSDERSSCMARLNQV